MLLSELAIHHSPSISTRFAEARPVPAAYFRAFWPRFARIGEDVGRCTHVVEQLVVLRSAIRARPAPQPVALKAAKHFAHKAPGILHKNGGDVGGGFGVYKQILKYTCMYSYILYILCEGG